MLNKISLQKKYLLYILPIGFSFLYGFYLGLSDVSLIVLSLLFTILLAACLRTVIQAIDRKAFHILLGAALLTLLFLLMLPYSALLKKADPLSAYFNKPGDIGLASLLTNVKSAYLLIFTSALVFGAICRIWDLSANLHLRAKSDLHNPAGSIKRVFFYSLPNLLIFALFLYAYWPGNLSADSYVQWAAAHDFRVLNDWNPVGHTLLEFVLYKLWDTPAIVSIIQILAATLVWANCLSFFEMQGIDKKLLFVISCLFALLPFNGILLVTIWKDILYSIMQLALTFLLGLIWFTDGKWMQRTSNLFILGFVMASLYLFRHNGLLILIVLPFVLLFFFFKQWRGIGIATIIALFIVVGIRDGIAFKLLNAVPNKESVAYSVPVQHIGAVIFYDGHYTIEQKELFERIATIAAWKNAYRPYSADELTKPWGILGDANILDKIGSNKQALLFAFFDLAVKNPEIVLLSERNLMNLLWEITEPDRNFRYWKYDFILVSQEDATKPANSLPFFQPNLSSPIKTTIDQYINDSWTNGVTQVLFWRGGWYLFLTLCLALISFSTKGYKSLILFVPIITNTLALFLSMTVSNFRYIYPSILSTLLLVLFTFIKKPNNGENLFKNKLTGTKISIDPR